MECSFFTLVSLIYCKYLLYLMYIIKLACFYYKTGHDDFVCVEVLRPSQPNGVMSSGVSLPNHTLTGQAYPLSG